MSSRTFLKILEELGWPYVFLVDPKQFKTLEGDSVSGLFGISARKYPVITIAKGLRGRVLKNTLYHEIFHILFRRRKHWWIECAAEKMANGGGRGYWSTFHGHTADELPSRSVLLKSIRKSVIKYNKKILERI